MSAGEIAGLIAAGALVLLVVLVAVPLLKLGRTLDETTLTIRQVREQSAPILTQANTTVTHVNSNLERVDDITGNAANVSSNVAALTSVVAATLGSPLIKVAAFSYGVRSATKKKREGQAMAEAARRDKDARRARVAPLGGPPDAPAVLAGHGHHHRCPGRAQAERGRREDDPGRHRPRRSPTALRDLADAIGDFGADIRAAAAEREAELRAGTGLDAPAARRVTQIQLPGRRGAHCRRPLTPGRPRRARSSRAGPAEPSRTDADRRDPSPIPRALRRARAHRRPQRLAGLARPVAAVHRRRHGAVHPVPHRPGAGALPAGDQRAEVRAHPRHRGGGQDHPARHVLPDERQLLLRRLLQGRRDPVRLGADHQARSTTAAWASTPRRSG